MANLETNEHGSSEDAFSVIPQAVLLHSVMFLIAAPSNTLPPPTNKYPDHARLLLACSLAKHALQFVQIIQCHRAMM